MAIMSSCVENIVTVVIKKLWHCVLGFNLSGQKAVDRTVALCPFEGQSAVATLRVAEAVLCTTFRIRVMRNWSLLC